MTSLRKGCSVATLFTLQELGSLTALEEGAHAPQEFTWCALAPGHGGPWHYAPGYQEGGQGWWLRWSDRARELLALPYCPVGDPVSPAEDARCRLPEDHPGVHGFAYAFSSASSRRRQLTVGDLRAAMETLPDHAPVRIGAATHGIIPEDAECLLAAAHRAMAMVGRGAPEGQCVTVPRAALILLADVDRTAWSRTDA